MPATDTTDRIVRRCTHAIATGTWAGGQKLPSIRTAERLWGVSRLTVLGAYRRMEQMGLVRSVDRSGYYVQQTPPVRRLTRNGVELRNLYDTVRREIDCRTGLSTLGTFRFLAELAEAEAREHPECAFVECTLHEAKLYAAQVTARLRVPCLALTTEGIGGRPSRVPAHVRTLLTTAYHRAELEPLAACGRFALREVPIEMAPGVADSLAGGRARITLLGVQRVVLEDMARDLAALLDAPRSPIEVEEVPAERTAETLTRRLGSPDRPTADHVVLLSPTAWEAAGDRWRACMQTRPVHYRLRDDAMAGLADTLGLPLGLTY